MSTDAVHFTIILYGSECSLVCMLCQGNVGGGGGGALKGHSNTRIWSELNLGCVYLCHNHLMQCVNLLPQVQSNADYLNVNYPNDHYLKFPLH